MQKGQEACEVTGNAGEGPGGHGTRGGASRSVSALWRSAMANAVSFASMGIILGGVRLLPARPQARVSGSNPLGDRRGAPAPDGPDHELAGSHRDGLPSLASKTNASAGGRARRR